MASAKMWASLIWLVLRGYWGMLGAVGEFWRILGDAEESWGCWRILGDVEGWWGILGVMLEGCLGMLEDFFGMLGDIGECLGILGDLQGCWGEVRGCFGGY